jgi:HSP20 family protein
MKSVQYHPARIANPFNSMLDGIFDREIGSFFGSDNFASQPLVNILETSEGYGIEIAAPGLAKEDFEIQAEGAFLTVSARQKQEGALHRDGKILRKEFNFATFSRRFRLSNGVDLERITARYENGVLKITLLKSEAELKQSRSVEIL